MTDIIKSLKNIDLASITVIGASINFIWSVIIAILLLIYLSVITGSININVIILLLAMMFSVLIFSIPEYFGRAYLFNFLISKLKEINIKIVDMDKITNISIFSSALLCSIIALIISLITYPGILVAISLLSPVLQQLMFIEGGFFLIYAVIQLSNPLIIAYSFILTFISVVIATFIFNLISPKIGGLKLELTQEEDMTRIDSINYLNLALIFATIAATIGLVIGIIISIIAMNFAATISLIIYLIFGGFVGGFIVGGLTAILYNFLAPRMGGLKIELVESLDDISDN
ncbi:MAG: hypothetical protein LBU74_07230 [Methanobacteriaceae archaeon]|jgi:hypothetical protein|nr:hypothetical protein [Candidatus Methanorudis spinitermitis]